MTKREDVATLGEIALALGKDKSTVSRRAEKESWPFEEIPHRGQPKRLCPLASLPKDVQEALDAQAQTQKSQAHEAEFAAMQAVVEAAHRDGTVQGRQFVSELERAQAEAKMTSVQARLEMIRRWPSLTENQLARMAGRREVVNKYEAWLKTKTGGQKKKHGTKALEEFAQHYKSMGAGCAETTRAVIPKLSGRNLRRWVEGYREEGLAALLDGKDGKDMAGHGKIADQPEMKSFVEALLVEHPHITDRQIECAIGARLGERLAPVSFTLKAATAAGLLARPEISSIRHFREAWCEQHAAVRLAMMNPDGWKNEQMLAFGDASADITHPNQRWEMDSTPGDVLLLEPEAKSGTARYHVLGTIDIYTRRLKLLVAKSSKSLAIGALVRRAIMDWGFPESRKADNGQDYQARYLNDFFDAIGTERIDCDPFSGWQKPHIERGFRTFSHGLLELAPGFIGHNVAQRKEIEARASFSERLFQKDGVLEVSMTADDFQTWCDDWVDNIYSHNPHDGLGDKTPFQVTAEWLAPVTRITDVRQLDMLLAPMTGSNGGLFSLQKKGIRIQKHWYIAPELGARTVGERIRVKEDVADIGRKFIYDADWGFICIAECPELTGVSQAEIAMKAKAIQRETISEQKAAMKRLARKADVKDIHAEIMRDRAAQAGKLAMLPRASIPHDNEALRQAGRAADVAENDRPAVSGGDMVIGGRTISAAELAQAPKAPVLPLPEKPKARSEMSGDEVYSQWLAIGERIQRGESVSEADAKFYALWPKYPQGKAILGRAGNGR